MVYDSYVMLKPQDILLLLKVICLNQSEEKQTWTQVKLGESIGLSAAEVNKSLQRVKVSALLREDSGSIFGRVVISSLQELLIHGVRHVFPPQRGAIQRGMPTASFAVPMSSHLVTEGQIPLVWPAADGSERGESLLPIYPSVPHAARNDANLYRFLTLVDSIRVGKARERKLAGDLLQAGLRGRIPNEQAA